MEKYIFILIFMPMFLLFYQVFKHLLVNRNSIHRIKNYINTDDLNSSERKKDNRNELKYSFYQISKRMWRFKLFDGYRERVRVNLLRANILLKPEEFITISLIIMIGIGIAVFLTFESIGVAVIGLIIGFFIPEKIIKTKIKKRLKCLNEQLSDALSLISSSLKVGYSFFQAIETVANEMNGPIAEEFKVLQKEINLGTPTEAALENMLKRVTSDDLDLVITAVLIQRQIGGNLSEILDNITATIRERVRIKGEVKTLTAQGRLSGIIISLLPPSLCGTLFLINREFMEVLFKSSLGIAIIVFSLIMELMGIFFINKIVKIEV
jgi:tight adherence protein B